ncbi:MAG: hypothetical protein NC834_02595 [Candidatus Omnitrophica bacterium]|nr:hypothetical protein [Candidatus Omnitrophota bacterium]
MAKKMDLRELYPEEHYGFIDESLINRFVGLPNREIALHILAYKYNRKPSVIRDWISKAKRDTDMFKALLKYLSSSRFHPL